MKLWDDIVNKATLGSAKIPLQTSDLPALITEALDVDDHQDPEENFLRISALVYQFRQSGGQPISLKSVTNTTADSEIKLYCPQNATGILKSILSEEHYPLLALWLNQCAAKNFCTDPEVLPQLLDIAVHRKDIRNLIIGTGGKRAEWLLKLNPYWDFSLLIDKSVVWETGRPEERRQHLSELRQENPLKALELLQTTWPSEALNEKISFLEILKTNLSDQDVLWLESLKEKGQKINNVIGDLLKSSPTATLVHDYASLLKGNVNVKSGKALLGMISKTTLEVNEDIEIPEAIFKTGIQKLSSDKNVSDGQYILVQLISCVPPTLWQDHFQLSAEEVIKLFQKEKKTAFYVPALAIAAIRFRDYQWVKYLLDYSEETINNVSLVQLIASLRLKDRDFYARKYFKQNPQEITQVMSGHDEEWSLETAKEILRFTANEVYSYNRTFYRAVVPLIPIQILDLLDTFIPPEEQKKVYWKNQSDDLARLLTLKKQTLEFFNV